MGMLVEGEWTTQWYKPDEKGRFVRKPSSFRHQVTEVREGRFHLYVSWACPWAHRALIIRKLRGLEDVIGLSVVDHFMGDDGWAFSENPGCIPDTVHGKSFLRELYVHADPKYTGRVTVPVLWDKEQDTIVNNESREIIRMFDRVFGTLGKTEVNFCPPELESKVDETIDAIYEPINNGVYRSGFARTQEAYDHAVTELFGALDHWDGVLSKQRYLCGDVITEADWCLFTTLVRFDAVYHGHFKCNLKRIMDYPSLSNYLRELYQVPGVSETVNFAHIKDHYYQSHTTVNPTQIVPKGPIQDLNAPHNRG